MKYDGAIVEYSKLETFYMVNFDLEEQTELGFRKAGVSSGVSGY